ncbi:MAG: CBS domain-containing protein [Flaviramulus sp.]|nr:CBS domain-containing protein [Flaviramulus sp.]
MIRKEPISMIMTTPVVTLTKNDSLEKAEHLFKKNHIRHIPIVENDKIIGMLSHNDILRLSFSDYAGDFDGDMDAPVYNMFSINHIMTRNVVTISSSNSIKDVAEIIASKEFHALPVISHKKLIGIVTTTDLIKYLLKQF